uniref:Uncharacterized protein n=1 Tax=Arundo donax TaxID=35708 RepID=A0A0A9B178_ARUDO
MGWGHCST